MRSPKGCKNNNDNDNNNDKRSEEVGSYNCASSESESLSGIHNGFDFVPALGIANNIIKM